MGMSCSLHRATAAEIEELIRNPDDLARFLGLDDGPPVREVRPKGLLGLLLRLTPITITEVDPDAPEWKAPAPDPEKSIDIDKGWHGLHFLLTGTADEGEEPACYIWKGGEALDDEGFGRALRPDQVRRFGAFLSTLSTADLERRYDHVRMTKLEIYPFDVWKPSATPDDSPFEWLLECFKDVQSFVDRAAAAGDGVIVHIS